MPKTEERQIMHQFTLSSVWGEKLAFIGLIKIKDIIADIKFKSVDIILVVGFKIINLFPN